MDLVQAYNKVLTLRDNVQSVIKGKTETVDLAITALLCNGHLLIEDVPGVGKTMLARAMAKSIDATFHRIQFTPDLLPSDVTGVSIYNQKTAEFEFQPGPLFANIVLIDEINRTTPRTQSSLLEAMEERQVTIDGLTRDLPKPFIVVATQNPIEFYGTYPLPEGQRDRFMISVGLGYPSFETEQEITLDQMKQHPIDNLKPVLTLTDIGGIQESVKNIYVKREVLDYAVAIVQATREHESLILGASPRGTLALVRAAQACAMLDKRDYVLPDDIKRISYSVLPHRFISRERTSRRLRNGSGLMDEILEMIPVPVGPSEYRGGDN
ncbi:MAG: MoxR family ATPase [Actinobacteria bacterium]|nr:MoxR family ATPase [Actinomycetota bacterium]